jgi:hypothetical protein
MTRSVRFSRRFLPVLLVLVVGGWQSTAAEAACFAGPAPAKPSLQRGPALPPRPPGAGLTLSNTSGLVHTVSDDGPASAVVGLWNAEFFLGHGPDRYDQTFQQFHAGGTELMLSNGLPPVLGNVCVGLWKNAGGRTVKVKHMAWNWEASGAFAGTFVMEIELRVSRDGRSYTGTWTADSFDLNGAIIPAMHAEGVARARRIRID